ncbi:MAG: MATE family efflux transporter [Ruminococcus sp.]|nr:MATE family efflux transporter [Ruminococcus sp.]
MDNKMAVMPVGKLMIKMGLPIIISMMLQALYNIVDSAFVSNMEGGEQALNALTLAFPVQMLMVAVGIGTGVGVNVMLARSLGEKNAEKASTVAGNGVFLGLVITAVFMLFGFFGVNFYIGSQTSDTVIFDMAVTYLRICCICSVGIVFFSVFEKLLQASGLSVQSTIAQISGAVINIILDPIMIYGLFGFPKLGVSGAALATVIGQIDSFLIALIFHLKFNKAVKNGLRYIKPNGTVIKLIYRIGLPAIIAQALMSVMTYGINLILGAVDASLVTAYGLYYKIQQFILFAAFGLRDTITPIVSFAFGMRDKRRVKDGIRFGVLYTSVIMLAGTVLLELTAEPLCSAFGLSGQTQSLCVSAVRIISAGFLFAGISLSLQGVFQALDRGLSSLIISLLRQLVLVLPVAWLFSGFVNGDLSNAWLIWLTFPVAELITAAVAVLLMKPAYKKTVKTL